VQCGHLECYCLLPLVRFLIQFDQICASSGTHACYHPSDELSLYVVVRKVPPQVLYTPCSVIYSFLGASQAVIQDVL